MVMAVDESLVKLELSEAGEPTALRRPAPEAIRSGFDRLGVGGLENKRRIADWNWRRSSGASAEKGRIILETSARELVPGLLDIRDWNE